MPVYKFRQVEKKLTQYAKYFKVILVTGARQVGKSTMLQHLFPEYKRFTFDPVQDLYGARRDPDLFLDTFPPPLVLDEIQFAPELLPAIKRRVDTLNHPGQYFLTGSQNLAVLKSVAESLAGRVGIINLEGMTIQEIFSRPEDNWLAEYLQSPTAFCKRVHKPVENDPLVQILWRGSLPGILEMPNDIVAGYFRSYIQT